MKGLIIKPKWADLILSGEKTWEIRGNQTHQRGRIGIIKSGSGMIFGTVDLIDSFVCGYHDFKNNVHRHAIKQEGTFFRYNQSWAWVMQDPIIYQEPIPYNHPQGAIIWVNLGEEGIHHG